MADDDDVIRVVPSHDSDENARLAEETRAKAKRIEDKKARDKARDPDDEDHRGRGRHKRGRK